MDWKRFVMLKIWFGVVPIHSLDFINPYLFWINYTVYTVNTGTKSDNKLFRLYAYCNNMFCKQLMLSPGLNLVKMDVLGLEETILNFRKYSYNQYNKRKQTHGKL